jgi:hypothetical protein
MTNPNQFTELIDKVRATNPSQPLVYVYSKNNKQLVETMYGIKLDAEDELRLGVRFQQLPDITPELKGMGWGECCFEFEADELFEIVKGRMNNV